MSAYMIKARPRTMRITMSGPKQRQMPEDAPRKISRVRVQGFDGLGFQAHRYPRDDSQGENARNFGLGVGGAQERFRW